jgi:hypothetical protein
VLTKSADLEFELLIRKAFLVKTAAFEDGGLFAFSGHFLAAACGKPGGCMPVA